MKKIITASLLAAALSGCVSIYESPRPAPAPACLCRENDGDDAIYRMKNGRWYLLREGVCPCVRSR